ncbi:MAG: molecular chaperone DnaJ [Armatimonadetes bacterium]|nr:molecular chaperone DnaJ [Armatimonadota bacterium]
MPVSKRDFYEVLGVARDAADKDIRAAYRKLARRYHPDVCDEPDAHERFQEIGEAYAVLSDAERRAHYDRFGHVGPGGVGFDMPTDIFDLFQSVVGGFGFGHERVASGSDLEHPLPISLEDVATGFSTEIAVGRFAHCEACGGEGAEPGSSREQCTTCRGLGRVRYRQSAMLLTFTQEAECPDCSGTGVRILNPCKACRGAGRARVTERVQVQVPPGVQDGQRIRYHGGGDAGPLGARAGDLYVAIRVRPHEVFVRRGSDLVCEVEVAFPQAALGDIIEVPGILKPHELTIPHGTQHGDALIVRGGGLPELRRPERRGDLHVLIRVAVPRRLNKAQRKALEQLAHAMDLDVRPQDSGLRSKISEVLGG